MARRATITMDMLENKRERLDNLDTSRRPTSVKIKLIEEVRDASQILVVSETPAITRIEAE